MSKCTQANTADPSAQKTCSFTGVIRYYTSIRFPRGALHVRAASAYAYNVAVPAPPAAVDMPFDVGAGMGVRSAARRQHSDTQSAARVNYDDVRWRHVEMSARRASDACTRYRAPGAALPRCFAAKSSPHVLMVAHSTFNEMLPRPQRTATKDARFAGASGKDTAVVV